MSGYKSRDSVPKLVEDYMNGVMKVDEFISFYFPIEDLAKAFQAMKDGTA